MRIRVGIAALLAALSVVGRAAEQLQPVADVVAEAPGGVFREGDRLAFRVCGAKDESWQLFDWQGRLCGFARKDGAGRVVFDAQPPGYYQAKGAMGWFPACVVRRESNRDEDSFFAADSGFTQCARPGKFACPWGDGDSYELVSGLLEACGITHTRERIFWTAMEQKPGVYDFGPFVANARLLKSQGVESLGLFGEAPLWQRKNGRSLPTDLVATYRFMEAASRTFDGCYDAWEFLNEPELGSVKEPAWEYVAALKAYALGARAGNPHVTLLPASLSSVNFGYGRVLFGGEIAKYVQAFNLHTYVPLADYPAFHENMRKFLREAGVPDWQVWLTECGTELEGSAAAKDASGERVHSPEQEMIVAEYYPKSNVLHRFGGVFRNWYFLFGYYNERGGSKVWGSLRRDGSAKPVHASIAAMTGELGSAEQVGAVRVGAGVRAFLYAQKDGRKTLVFWSPSPVDRGRVASDVLGHAEICRCELSLPVTNGDYRLVDMMGTPSVVSVTNGVLPLVATRYPQYLTGNLDLPVVKRSAPVGKLANYVPAEDEDLTVVIWPRANEEDFSVVNRKSVLELGKESGRIAVEVWNLSGTPKRGQLQFSCGDVADVPDGISLPAWGKSVVECRWTPPEDGKIDYALDIYGVFDGKRITRARLPVTHRSRFLRGCSSRPLPGFLDETTWKRNDSADAYACVYDKEEEGLRIEAKWNGPGNRWIYPIHELKPTEESFADAKFVEFEIKSIQDKMENDFSHSEFMLDYPDGRCLYLPYVAPGFNWEKRLVRLPEDAKDCVAVRVGANPRGNKLTYWVRNFKLLR